MKVLWVSPDYADAKPKPCMAGWGAVFMVVAPDGIALPCHSARMLPGIEFPNLREHAPCARPGTTATHSTATAAMRG